VVIDKHTLAVVNIVGSSLDVLGALYTSRKIFWVESTVPLAIVVKG